MQQNNLRLLIALLFVCASASLGLVVQAFGMSNAHVAATATVPTLPSPFGTVVVLQSADLAADSYTYLPFVIARGSVRSDPELTPTLSNNTSTPEAGTPESTPGENTATPSQTQPSDSTTTATADSATATTTATSMQPTIEISTVTPTVTGTQPIVTPGELQVGLWSEATTVVTSTRFYVNADHFTLTSVVVYDRDCNKEFRLPNGFIQKNGFSIRGINQSQGITVTITGTFTSDHTATGTWRIDGSAGCGPSPKIRNWDATYVATPASTSAPVALRRELRARP